MSYILWIILIIISLFLYRKWVNSPYTPYNKDMTDKIVIVTGSSAGIGKETAKSLLRNGATVIFANRDEKKTKLVMNKIIQDLKLLNLNSIKTINERSIFIKLDLSSFESVVKFVKEFNSKFNQLDILVNNAGAGFVFFNKTEDNLESTWQVNHLSPTFLTSLLLDKLSNAKEARIINVSSRVHKIALKTENYFEFNQSNPYFIITAYAASKCGNIFMTELLKEYSENKNLKNLKSAVLHPGEINTEIWRPETQPLIGKILYYLVGIWVKNFLFRTEEAGAQTTLHLCYMDFNEFVNGAYYVDCKTAKTADIIRNEEYKKRSLESTYKSITESKVFKELTNKEDLELIKILKNKY